MLGRKQSIKVGDTSMIEGANGPGGDPNALAGQSVTVDVAHLAGTTGVAWFNKTSVRHFMRICSVASLISVCANTSRTFSWYPTLMLITFVVDIITGIVFTIEMVFKIHNRGLLKGSSPYARDRWCQFDATMVLFIWISILLQVSTCFPIACCSRAASS